MPRRVVRDEPETVDAEEAPIPVFGSEDHPYGRTNHAMSEDEVRAAAEAEGTLRPDGRAKGTLFFDDVLAAEADRLRVFAENGGREDPEETTSDPEVVEEDTE